MNLRRSDGSRSYGLTLPLELGAVFNNYNIYIFYYFTRGAMMNRYEQDESINNLNQCNII